MTRQAYCGVTCLDVNVFQLAFRVAEFDELSQSLLDKVVGYSKPGLHVRLQVFSGLWIVKLQGTNSGAGHEKVLCVLKDGDGYQYKLLGMRQGLNCVPQYLGNPFPQCSQRSRCGWVSIALYPI